jgi:23S rRNA G2069 N7-methylase RlmK/C1962 C5-methylase RlmI
LAVLIRRSFEGNGTGDDRKALKKRRAYNRSGFSSRFSFTIGDYPEGRAVDVYRDAIVFETIQEGVNERLSLEEVVPFGVV